MCAMPTEYPRPDGVPFAMIGDNAGVVPWRRPWLRIAAAPGVATCLLSRAQGRIERHSGWGRGRKS